MSSIISSLKTFAVSESFEPNDFDHVLRRANRVVRSNGWLAIGLVAPNGRLILSTLEPKGIPQKAFNVSDETYIQQALRTRQPSISDFRHGRISEKPVISIAVPVLDLAGQVRLILSASITVNTLFDLLYTRAVLVREP